MVWRGLPKLLMFWSAELQRNSVAAIKRLAESRRLWGMTRRWKETHSLIKGTKVKLTGQRSHPTLKMQDGLSALSLRVPELSTEVAHATCLPLFRRATTWMRSRRWWANSGHYVPSSGSQKEFDDCAMKKIEKETILRQCSDNAYVLLYQRVGDDWGEAECMNAEEAAMSYVMQTLERQQRVNWWHYCWRPNRGCATTRWMYAGGSSGPWKKWPGITLHRCSLLRRMRTQIGTAYSHHCARLWMWWTPSLTEWGTLVVERMEVFV